MQLDVMPKPVSGDWVAIAFTLLGVPLVWVKPSVAAIWIALWLGTAIMLISSRQRLPRFTPRKSGGFIIQHLDQARVEGAPFPYGWWWMIFPITLCCSVAPASLLVSEGGLWPFAIPSGLTLLLWLGFSVAHERASAKIMGRVIRAGRERRVVGVVSDLQGDFIRTISWRTWSGTHHGTAQVDSVHGGQVTVATVTHTTNTLGYCEELRHTFTLTVAAEGAASADSSFCVDVASLMWAAPHKQIDPSTAPILRKMVGLEGGALNYIAPVGVDIEQLRQGDHAVVLAPAQDILQSRLRGSPTEPLVVYVTAGDPMKELGQMLAIRWASTLGIAACFAMVAWLVVIS